MEAQVGVAKIQLIGQMVGLRKCWQGRLYRSGTRSERISRRGRVFEAIDFVLRICLWNREAGQSEGFGVVE